MESGGDKNDDFRSSVPGTPVSDKGSGYRREYSERSSVYCDSRNSGEMAAGSTELGDEGVISPMTRTPSPKKPEKDTGDQTPTFSQFKLDSAIEDSPTSDYTDDIFDFISEKCLKEQRSKVSVLTEIIDRQLRTGSQSEILPEVAEILDKQPCFTYLK